MGGGGGWKFVLVGGWVGRVFVVYIFRVGGKGRGVDWMLLLLLLLLVLQIWFRIDGGFCQFRPFFFLVGIILFEKCSR